MSFKRKASSSAEDDRARRPWFWESAFSRMFGNSTSPGTWLTSQSTKTTAENCDPENTDPDGDTLSMEMSAAEIDLSEDSSQTDTSSDNDPHGSNLPAGPTGSVSLTRAASPCSPLELHPVVEEERAEEVEYELTTSHQVKSPTGDNAACTHDDVQMTAREEETVVLSPYKDAPIDGCSHSRTLHTAFQTSYGCEQSQDHFIGLCAYLSCILRLGYRIQTADMDGFIRLYSTFSRQSIILQRTQIESSSPHLISYHQWYAEHKDEAPLGRRILTEQNLRNLWSENPFTFLKVQYSMELVVRDRTNGQTG